MIQLGIYEQLVTKMVSNKLNELDTNIFYLSTRNIDKVEASKVLTTYLSAKINLALSLISGEDSILKQIKLANQIILLLASELNNNDFQDDIIETEAKILYGVFSKIDNPMVDFEKYLKEITPYSKLSQCDLFTGNNAGISLESEIKKEIRSSDEIYFLVSFIKWTGIRIFENELKEFTEKGGKLKIITTSYMGATDAKAVEFLANLPNAQVKVSYNSENERLHAKAYLFRRKTGFHTGYIGSSNISKSALTTGLEWNIKVTTQEANQIIDKFYKTFETYWEDKDFTPFSTIDDREVLRDALKKAKNYQNLDQIFLFDIKPFPFQEEILEKLEVEREIHNRYKNLVVAATGTGKTVISAFDFKKFRQKNNNARLLFISHRKEILVQALNTFRGILKDNNFGELWVEGTTTEESKHVFATIQTLNSQKDVFKHNSEFYDFIIIDEVHHISASSYRPIINHFKPTILLGLTATPERMDQANILDDFCNTIAAEIRLPEALNRKLLCPFQYFGISDSIDLSGVKWEKGKYNISELTHIYTNNDRRVGEILGNLDKYLTNINDVRALCFCISIEHATYMARKFTLAGLKANYITSNSNKDIRNEAKSKLISKEINYLFVVDIFNEGIDIPEIDTVLFLRPTESLTVFLQQLGRGLRLSDGKECLTVLDFVGNARPEYDFEGKFRALIGKTTTPIKKEIIDNFPHLPLGCSIILEEKAKRNILNNIINATSLNQSQLITKIKNYQFQTSLPLTLKNFIHVYNIPLNSIYKFGTWKRLCCKANIISSYAPEYEHQIWTAIRLKWLAATSTSYFTFILKLAKNKFNISIDSLPTEEKQMALMLFYDIWKDSSLFQTLEESIQSIGKNPILVDEIREIMEVLLDRIDYTEYNIDLPFSQPLKVHSRYTRDQILAAFSISTFEKKSSNREGCAENKQLNAELLFIDLVKSEEDFSPSHLYQDFAISPTIFHWQTQNSARPDMGRGLSYINHISREKQILLFVREKNNNEFNNTMAYVFLGKGKFLEYYGSKPMSIHWELSHKIPPYLWTVAAKMAVG